MFLYLSAQALYDVLGHLKDLEKEFEQIARLNEQLQLTLQIRILKLMCILVGVYYPKVLKVLKTTSYIKAGVK